MLKYYKIIFGLILLFLSQVWKAYPFQVLAIDGILAKGMYARALCQTSMSGILLRKWEECLSHLDSHNVG